jgi:hypothetical protein
MQQQIGMMQALNFRDKDLEDNRSGILSDPQRRRIRVRQIWHTIGWLVFAAPYVFAPIANPPSKAPRNPATDCCITLCCAVMFIGFAMWELLGAQMILVGNHVESISGPLKHRIDREGRMGTRVLKLAIADKAFKVSNKARIWFDQGEHYTFYYVALPGTNLLLSAEPIDVLDTEIEEQLPSSTILYKSLVHKINDD